MRDTLAVAVIGLMPFPEGGAAVSRLRSLALGLYQAGAQVSILAFASPSIPQESLGIEQSHIWRDIPCRLYRGHAQLRPVKTSRVLWALRRLAGKRTRSTEMQAIYDHLEALCEAKTVDTVLFYNQDPAAASKLLALCHRHNVCFIQQYAEYELPHDYPQGFLSPPYLRHQLHMRLIPPRSDGNIVISTYLDQRCKQAGARSSLLIPALTNTEQSLESSCVAGREERTSFTFTYLGKGARRDCLDLVLQAAKRLVAQGTSFRLQLLGLSNESRCAHTERVRQLQLSEHVFIHGWLEEQELRQALVATDAFLLVRSDDRSSWACFPTRLPEFLALAKPVILSSIPDFTRYFRHNENALLVPPGDAEALCEAMTYLATRQEEACRIGCAGQRLCETEFSYNRLGAIVCQYLLDRRQAIDREMD